LLGFQHPLIFFALFFIKDRFAKTDLFRRHFNAFVLLDIFHAFLERHLFFRGDAYGVIASAGAHIGQLFPFRGVDDEIARLDMLRDDLTGIDVLARIDEEGASVLQLIDGIGRGLLLVLAEEHAVVAAGDGPFPGFIFQEPVGHDGLARGTGKHITPQTDKTPARDFELEMLHFTLGVHYMEFPFSLRDQIDDLAAEFGGDIDNQDFIRLVLLAVDLFYQNLRLPDGELEAFATHGLDEDSQVEDAAAIDEEAVGAIRVFYFQREILFRLFQQTIAQVTRSDEFAVFPIERGIVDAEQHAHGGFVNADDRKRFGVFRIRDGIADVEIFEAYDGADIACHDLGSFLFPHAHECVQLFDPRALDAAVGLRERDRLSFPDRTPGHLAHRNPAQERRVIQRSDLHLQRTLGYIRFGNILEDTVQQGCDILAGLILAVEPAVLPAAVERREIQLFFRCVEIEEKLKNCVMDLVRTAVRFVHLIDNDNGLQVKVQGLLQYEAGLGHRPLESIDKEKDAIGHFQHALDFTHKIRVTRSIDNVDLGALILDGSILAEDRDAPFFLEIVIIHDQLAGFLVLPEYMSSM